MSFTLFEPLVRFQLSLRKAVFKFIGRVITGIDRLVYSWTRRYEHLELDLIGPRPGGVGRWSPKGFFARLSFPHMAATAVVWIDILAAMSLLEPSEGLASTLYHLAPVLYVGTFIAAARLRPRLSGHAAETWIIGGTKITGLGFASFTLFIAGMVILPIAAILAFLWLIAAVLCIVLVPGLGWAVVMADVKSFWSLVRPRRATS